MQPKELTTAQLAEIARRNGRRSARAQVPTDVYDLLAHIEFLKLVLDLAEMLRAQEATR